jgi:hypothetical protein
MMTGNQAQDYLLTVMDHIKDNDPSKGNGSMTKMQAWDIFIRAVMGFGDKEIPDLLQNNIEREFGVTYKMLLQVEEIGNEESFSLPF